MHGPFPPPFPGVKDGPSEPPALETKELSVQSPLPMPGIAVRGPGSPAPARPASGEDASPPSLLDVVQAPPSNPPPDSGDKPINESSFWAGDGSASQVRGNHHAWGLPPITLDPSVAGKFLQDQGHWPGLTQGEEQPSFHTELHSEPVALPPACQLTQPPA